MKIDRRERARVSAGLLARPQLRRPWPERPLRRLSRGGALALLALLALALAWSALAAAAPRAPAAAEPAAGEAPIGDFALYARIASRVAAGEGYHDAALAEHRAHAYPVRPFVAVRLPTLAWADAALGRGAVSLAVALLLLANLAAWYLALGERSRAAERIGALGLAFLAGLASFEPRAGLSHELVAGLLVSLSLALYRPGFATPALLALAAALAVRELAAPFALAWLALALAERRWREAGALAALLALFAAGLALHGFEIGERLVPGDRASPGWGGMAGPAVVLEGLVRFTPLLGLPHALAGPLAVLPLIGWIGLGGRLGLLAALWFTGFALAMALLARPDNFYWALLLLPAWFVGLALAPRALADLLQAVRGRGGG